ncbi:metal-dependent transcriptional regulator [Methanolobus profundi]|uniref:Mn-dependent transcriptional regulator, DtxR family n=1 Tax=Methanolobus profundi TaxID=487685 RepID=A0A1I4QNV6_9EURY|nr:metal-dependent transcriptional regulator [Methanolobus profundi]SFM41390.1 Mn-dependent transcriptional regulator, DtxR family [Methanolobus profundi]
MQEITGLELSPKKVEYLKFLLKKGDLVKTTDISNELHVDPSTTTKTITDLSESGYVDHVPYRGVRLTATGREYAEFFVNRHNILSLMLSHYGLSSEEACSEVSRFEAFVSKSAIDRICGSMGHPTVGVCGKIKHSSCSSL